MKKIDILSCVLAITTGFVGLAILDVCLEIRARLSSRKETKCPRCGSKLSAKATECWRYGLIVKWSTVGS